MLVEQAHEDKKSLSGDMSDGTRIRRDPKKPECRNPFKYSTCGPQMHITLSILPGTYLLPGQVSTTGGMMAQFMGGGLAMGQTMLSGSHEETREVYAMMDAGELQYVKLRRCRRVPWTVLHRIAGEGSDDNFS